MKTLDLEQMESIEAGGFWGIVGCLALGVATASPVVGFFCAALFNATPAYYGETIEPIETDLLPH